VLPAGLLYSGGLGLTVLNGAAGVQALRPSRRKEGPKIENV
jgi:hypothetical protein